LYSEKVSKNCEASHQHGVSMNADG